MGTRGDLVQKISVLVLASVILLDTREAAAQPLPHAHTSLLRHGPDVLSAGSKSREKPSSNISSSFKELSLLLLLLYLT